MSREHRSKYSTLENYYTKQSREERSSANISVKKTGKQSLQSVDVSDSDSGKSEMHSQSQLLTVVERKLLLEIMQADLRPEYRRRIEIMLLADMGYSRTQICAELGCSQETARHWIAMAEAGQIHKWNDDPIGRPQTVNEQYRARLKELVNRSPREYGYSFERWTAQYLRKQLAKELGISISGRHINRLLEELDPTHQHRRSRAKKVTNLSGTKESRITIRDLPSNSSPGFLWLFNLIPLTSSAVKHN